MATRRVSKRTRLLDEEERQRRLFEKYVPVADRVPKKEVIACRADVVLAARNVSIGVAAVLELEDVIRKELPYVDIQELRSLPDIATSVVYASTQVDRYLPSKEVSELMGRAREVRAFMLATAEALVHAKLLDGYVVAKIRAGKGDIDAVKDCIELAALFAKNAAKLRGKSPVTSAHIKEAAELGEKLIKLLKPKKVKERKKVAEEEKRAREVRDRLWTLVVKRHDKLRRVGAYLFGVEGLDQRVPGLQTRNLAKGSAKRSKTKTPVAVENPPVAQGAGEEEK